MLAGIAHHTVSTRFLTLSHIVFEVSVNEDDAQSKESLNTCQSSRQSQQHRMPRISTQQATTPRRRCKRREASSSSQQTDLTTVENGMLIILNSLDNNTSCSIADRESYCTRRWLAHFTPSKPENNESVEQKGHNMTVEAALTVSTDAAVRASYFLD